MNRDIELKWLYREITQMLVNAGAIPVIPFVKSPVDYIGDWAHDHPNQAYQLALNIRDKIIQQIP